MTTLSVEALRRLTSWAGNDSDIQCHWPAEWCSSPASSRYPRKLAVDRVWPNSWPSLNGNSNAAHLTWLIRIWRLSGLTSPDSGEDSNMYSGWEITYWSSGLLEATRTATDEELVRPARPICCQALAIVPG